MKTRAIMDSHYKICCKNEGMTILEVVIALSLSTFVLAGMLQIMTGTQQTQRLESSITEIQENGRYAVEALSRSLRYRGYLGCLLPRGDHVDAINLAATSFPYTDISRTSLRGFEVSSSGVWGPDPGTNAYNSDMVALKNGANGNPTPRPGSDVVSVQYASPTELTLDSDMVSPDSDIITSDTAINLNQNDVLLVHTCDVGDIFRVSNSPETSPPFTISHKNTHNSSDDLSDLYLSDNRTRIREFRTETYYVADAGRETPTGDKVYALFRLDMSGAVQELVEGVEYLQVMYGEELSTGNIRYVSADESTLDMRRVVSIQLGLLLSSTSESLNEIDYETYELPGETIGYSTTISHLGGKYFRKVFSSTVQLRNKIVVL